MTRLTPRSATRAALYARYSDDKQNEASIEDQFRLCRELAGRERWRVAGTYEDAAISGSSTIQKWLGKIEQVR